MTVGQSLNSAHHLARTTAVVLCGGLGTRLRSVTGAAPKALAMVAGRPFLSYLLQYLRQQGVRRVVLCVGHGAEAVEEFGGDGARWDLELVYSREPVPLGTGGAVKHAESLIGSDPLLLLNGDSMMRADLQKLYEFHRAAGAVASMVLAEVPDQSRFGSVAVGSGGTVLGFREKGTPGAGTINAGIYLANAEMLDGIAPEQAVSLERELFPSLVGRGLFGLVSPGTFIDIGTPDSFEEAQLLPRDWWEGIASGAGGPGSEALAMGRG